MKHSNNKINCQQQKDLTLEKEYKSIQSSFQHTLNHKINQWNISSLSPMTLATIKQNQPHIFCIQECRNKNIEQSPSQAIVKNKDQQILLLEEYQQGFTIRYLWKLQPFTLTTRRYRLLLLNNQSQKSITRFIYLQFLFRSQKQLKKFRMMLNQWFAKFFHIIKGNQQIIISGNFNISSTPFSLFNSVLPNYLKNFKRQQTVRQGCFQVEQIIQLIILNLTAHLRVNSISQLICEYISKYLRKTQILFLQIQQGISLNSKLKSTEIFSDFTCFYHYIKCNLRKYIVIQKINQKLLPTLNNKYELEKDLFSKIAQVFQTDKTKFYQLIKKQIILNNNIKEGGLYTYFKDSNDVIQIGDSVIISCYDQLDKISSQQELLPQRLPILSPLSYVQTQELQQQMSHDKTISFDGITDNFIRTCNKHSLLNDIWKQSTVETNTNCCTARLVPLYKMFPQVPTDNQFSPLTILSPPYKFLELRFLTKLQKQMTWRLTLDQTATKQYF